MSSIFSNLKSLGFDKLDDLEIYTEKDKPERQLKNTSTPKREIDINTLLYDKKVHCPVCSHDFTARTVKVSAPRIESKDSDFFIRYYVVNPYFYDVWVCPVCGYSAMKIDFPKIRSFQLEFIRNKISTQWKGRNYPSIYDEEIAIERYKLALLNAIVQEAKDSQKAMICLKLAWMYRLLDDNTNEKEFLKKALEGFLRAYDEEASPIYGLDRYSLMYLIGELYRRTGSYENGSRWLGNVVTSTLASQKIKDKARDMRELCKKMM